MTEEEIYTLIKVTLNEIVPGASDIISLETDLINQGILDSLDAMRFIFSLEKKLGQKIAIITEDNIDLLVSSIISAIMNN